MVVLASNLGFPRMGPDRELKKSLESYWAGKTSASELEATAAELRERNWWLQAALGIDHIPSGDFSLYDQVLDTSVLVGAVPERYDFGSDVNPLDRYFAMARGGTVGGRDVTALEMTKWFDTNYHYLVPELTPGQRFALSSTKPLDQFRQAAAIGITTRPVLLGPVSFLLLSKRTDDKDSNLDLLGGLCAVYAELLESLQDAGASWVQIDEPVLSMDLDSRQRDAFAPAYATLREAAPRVRLLVATYFAGLGDNLPAALALPVDALHLDAVAGSGQLETAVAEAPDTLALSVGIVDGRNVWRTDLDAALTRLEAARNTLGSERLLVAPSCSLLHLPVDLGLEPSLDPELGTWLAFAVQRLEEVGTLVRGLNEGRRAVHHELEEAGAACTSRAASPRVHDPAVTRRLAEHHPSLERRASPYEGRRKAQREHLGLPVLPTTTIGSFPQTPAVRALRAQYRRGSIDTAAYEEGLRSYVDDAVAFQEQVGLDVLVHGEPERNDMVEYFGDLLEGCAVTANGWVQSYGSRCVKPPVIFGDVKRAHPMTVGWAAYAQSRTDRPVKGMLTGPVTILEWSFVRNDQTREVTARQLAFAIRDEVADLESAGIKVIQIDEPALREGLPLHAAERNDYLTWAVGAFRTASSGVRDETQIHTHMCYGEFNDIIESIAAFDADVISIEASRSKMELLAAFTDFEYPNEIGPGIWDIHSPRVPETSEMVDLLNAALDVVPADRLWVNPDCGLKTRRWEEVRPALVNLVDAARQVRNSRAWG
ncbi:MAG TPA: 5-methyltetrahydropteroyltriglutamate--homocysteine S-methyltransferase [Acidimicrobiales bacterium]|jgi:5-methyltetrahydropteroyltriglutamate--homocysteine methyltransferase|nr:5-methyltetrahydropteroyltriglutamate--homocysteine S-methyltransferase [Acidimicrobiales bacterium]